MRGQSNSCAPRSITSRNVLTRAISTVRATEIVSKDPIHCAHDEGDDGLRSIENPTLDLLFLIVFSQEQLVQTLAMGAEEGTRLALGQIDGVLADVSEADVSEGDEG